MQTLIATNVVKYLAPFVVSANSPSVDNTDIFTDTRSPSANTELLTCVSSMPNTSSDERDGDLSLLNVEIKTTLTN